MNADRALSCFDMSEAAQEIETTTDQVGDRVGDWEWLDSSNEVVHNESVVIQDRDGYGQCTGQLLQGGPLTITRLLGQLRLVSERDHGEEWKLQDLQSRGQQCRTILARYAAEQRRSRSASAACDMVPAICSVPEEQRFRERATQGIAIQSDGPDRSRTRC